MTDVQQDGPPSSQPAPHTHSGGRAPVTTGSSPSSSATQSRKNSAAESSEAAVAVNQGTSLASLVGPSPTSSMVDNLETMPASLQGPSRSTRVGLAQAPSTLTAAQLEVSEAADLDPGAQDDMETLRQELKRERARSGRLQQECAVAMGGRLEDYVTSSMGMLVEMQRERADLQERLSAAEALVKELLGLLQGEAEQRPVSQEPSGALGGAEDTDANSSSQDARLRKTSKATTSTKSISSLAFLLPDALPVDADMKVDWSPRSGSDLGSLAGLRNISKATILPPDALPVDASMTVDRRLRSGSDAPGSVPTPTVPTPMWDRSVSPTPPSSGVPRLASWVEHTGSYRAGLPPPLSLSGHFSPAHAVLSKELMSPTKSMPLLPLSASIRSCSPTNFRSRSPPRVETSLAVPDGTCSAPIGVLVKQVVHPPIRRDPSARSLNGVYLDPERVQ